LAAQHLPQSKLRLLGFLPLAFFCAQGIHYWQINELGQMLWMCNIGNLLLAIGLFLAQPTIIRVAAIWTIPGLIVWFVYVVPTWGLLLAGKMSARAEYGVLSSTLAHVGGISVGVLALKRVRMDGRAWIYAFGWYLLAQLASRLVTPVQMNVNLSQNVQSGWEQTFTVYWKFWLVLSMLVAVGSWLLGLVLNRLWPLAEVPAEFAYSEKGKEPL
jgi:hypothetical protein